jgi:phosphoenolpyruvate carboxykinase (GTP)
MTSEKTAAASGSVGQLRRDPFAMLPFCGYNMGDYFTHWLNMGQKQGANLPQIFYVNWFRKDDMSKFLWPGYGENSRVLKWIFERTNGIASAVESPIGYLPEKNDISDPDLPVTDDELQELLKVDADEWKMEIKGIRDHFNRFGDHLPVALWKQLDALQERLNNA